MSDDVPLSFGGGPGGLDAQFSALDGLADTYDTTASRAVRWGAAAATTAADPALVHSGVYAPATFASVEAGLLGLSVGTRSLTVNAASWTLQAAAVRTVSTVFEAADAGIAGQVDAIQYGLGYSVGYLVGFAAHRAGSSGLPQPGDDLPARDGSGGGADGGGALVAWALANPDAFEALLGSGGGLVEGLWDASDGAATPGFGPWALPTTAAAAGALAGFYRQGTPVVDQVEGPVRGQAASDLAGLVRQLDAVSERSALPEGSGTIEIRRTGEGADAAYVVLLPGTDDLTTLPGEEDQDVRDAATNLASLGGSPTAYTAGIAEAMRSAGITADSAVTLVGHSQGGMAAVQIAASAEFDVAQVVTLGSPIAAMPAVPDGVQITALENRSDLVPHLDGQANPDRDHLLTVEFDLDGHSASSAHAIGVYERAAAAFDASDHASAQATRAALADANAVGDGEVTSTVYRITRELPPTESGQPASGQSG